MLLYQCKVVVQNLLIYLDDIIILGKDYDNNMCRLEAVFQHTLQVSSSENSGSAPGTYHYCPRD